MKNVIKGWVTSFFGLAVMVLDALFYFGVIKLPEAMPSQKPIEVLIAFLVGLALFVMPSTWIEEKINDIYNKKVK
jgi:uncharacterized membrane protein YhaH (DUF805 family)